MLKQDQYYIRPSRKPVCGTVTVPGSKSITNRALLLGCMAKGKSKLSGVLFSSDTRAFMDCLIKLGFNITINETSQTVEIIGGLPSKTANINVDSAGTAARFITALLAARDGSYHLMSSEQMMKRPMKPLLDVLCELGAYIEYEERSGFFPFILKGSHAKGKEVNIKAEMSSQFLSALLMTGCLYEKGLQLHTIGKNVAPSYIDITINMIARFQGEASRITDQCYFIKGGNTYVGQDYIVEPDVSSACYFYAMAALTGGSVSIKNIHSSSIQGDINFLKALEMMGCAIYDNEDGILLKGPKQLCGIDIDLNNSSDQTMTLAALAPFASTPTVIRNIEHIKHQETNRIQAIHNELTRMGIHCEFIESGIKIEPGKPKPANIQTYDDHRMAMAFSLVGIKADGIVIQNPSCVGKTFENYFEVFESVVY